MLPQLKKLDNVILNGTISSVCSAPTTQASAVTFSTVTATSMTVGWTRGNGNDVMVIAEAGGAPADLQAEHNTGNAAYGSGTPVGGGYCVYNGTGTSVNLTSLTSGTTYYFSIYEYSTTGTCYNLAQLSGTATTTSTCSQSLTYTQLFISTSIPACWTSQYVTGTDALLYVPSSSYPTTSPEEGSDYVNWNSFNYTSGDETRLVSPPITTTGSASVQVLFYWYNENNTTYSTGAYLNEGVTVQYSLDGSTWTDPGTFYSRHDASLSSGTGQWKLKTLTLPAGAGNQATMYVGFKFHSSYGDNCSLDNVVVQAAAAANTAKLAIMERKSQPVMFQKEVQILYCISSRSLQQTEASHLQMWVVLPREHMLLLMSQT